MSTHRSASLGPPSPDPHTPPQFIPQRTVSTEPKSDYLRGVLQSRRPKGSPSPNPPQPVVQEPQSEDEDGWSLAEDDGKRQKALSRHLRRLSTDATAEKKAHRQKTRAELEKDKDKMEKNNFGMALRLVLLEEQNAKLVAELEEARSRLEELEDLQEDYRELREERDMMSLKLQNVDTVLAAKDDDIAELTAINDETIKEMEKRDTGLEEAADMIISLEEENRALRLRLESSTATTAVNGHSDYSSNDGDRRLMNSASLTSIAESKVSSSEQHSDYYSQPASPQVKPSKTPSPKKAAGRFSTRVKSMISANSRGNGSVTELRKRISHVSLADNNSVYSLQQAPSAISSVPSLPNIEQHAARRGPNRVDSFSQLNRSSSSETLQVPSPRRGFLFPAPLALRDRFYHDQHPPIPESPTPGSPTPGHNSAVTFPAEDNYNVPPRSSSRDFTRRSSSAGPDQPFTAPDIVLPLPSPPSPTESTTTTGLAALQQNWWEPYQRLTAQQALGRPSISRTFTAPNLFNSGEDENEFLERMRYPPRRR